MARQLKCPKCGKLNDKENTIYFNKRYWCKECREKIESDTRDRNELIDYIMNLFEIDKPTGYIMKQIQKYIDQGYTYKGMYLTLTYFYDTLGNKLPIDIKEYESLGIIPSMYNRAKKHYIEIMKIEESCEEFNNNYEIKIYDYQKDIKNKLPKAIKQYNLEDIGGND